MDEQGYLKLVDFGTAKVLKGRTFTTIGTPHYMAPEVILGKGYGLSADIWSVGVMLYEFLCGGVPFGEDEDDPFKIYEKILRENLRWPSSIARASKVRDFIEVLLSKNEALRNSGVAQLRKHKWLIGFEWVISTQERLLLKQLPTPYLPIVRDLKAEAKESVLRDQPVTQAIQDSDDDLPDVLAPEPEAWDKDF